jgi:hypothetical protein
MTRLTRRSAFALGMIVPAFALPQQAAAADMYGADAGKEILPGVRQIDLGKFPIDFGGYKSAVVTDYASAPGSEFPDDVMKNDMVCLVLTGEFLVTQSGPGAQPAPFTVKAGGAFACAKDSHEMDKNTGSVQAVMRVIDLLPA